MERFNHRATIRYLHTSSFDRTITSQVIERNLKLELVEINDIVVYDWQYRILETIEYMNIICIEKKMRCGVIYPYMAIKSLRMRAFQY